MEFATGALGTLLPKLGQLLQGEYNLQKSAKKNIEFLSRELEVTRVALRHVGEVPSEQLNELVKIWARDVRELSYDMEDAVDTFLVRVQGPEPTSKKMSQRFVKRMKRLVSKAKIRHQIAEDIEDIKERVKEVADRRDRYSVATVNPPRTMIDPRITALYNNATNLVGIDQAREDLIRMLTNTNDMSTGLPKIVSVVGIGGLGKTTLAKVVYDKLKAGFDCAGFVSVSQNPSINKVCKDMLYELDKGRYQNIHSTERDEKQLIDLIRTLLQNKRYLIVIDDLWDIMPWEIIRCALSDNNMRSRIIITTRIIGVAKQIGDYYELKPLAHESSKKLFYGRIFESEDKCPRQFSEVSEKILKKCGGVPLAIVTTSSLLANKVGNINEWKEFCDSIGSGLDGDRDMVNMRKILFLSYQDLPSHLKTCLLYVSTFPEDYEIGTDRLIWRWIAEEFVQRGERGQSMFELGQSYFSELLNRSLIQPASVVREDEPLACRVHDMVLDLICSLSREENFAATILGDTKQTTISSGSNVRRLSLHSPTWPTISTAKLRSLTVFVPDIIMSMPSPASYHLLRVLDLQDCNFTGKESLTFVGNLLHLRYLGLRYSRYDGVLPVEIRKLQFLQTLNTEGAYIKELPPSTAELRQLMFLNIEPSTRLPNELRNLTLLEVLSVAGVDSATAAEELGHLTNLRLLYVHLQRDAEGRLDESMGKTFVKSIGNLQKIQTLRISFDVATDLEGSVESLGNLRSLMIYNGSSMPKWINPALLCLSTVQMTVTQVRMEDIQVLGMLPALRFLRVDVTGSADIQVHERFMVSTDAFPCIRVCIFLRFTTVPSMFPRGAMPRLEKFEFRIRLEEFATCGLDDLALGHFPSLQRVCVNLHGKQGVSEEVVQKVEELLRHEVGVHPNHPTVIIRSK